MKTAAEILDDILIENINLPNANAEERFRGLWFLFDPQSGKKICIKSHAILRKTIYSRSSRKNIHRAG